MTTATRAAATLSDGDPSTAVARALAPEITQRADDAEARGTMPTDLVDRLRAAGIFRALQPRSLGGFEVAPVEFIEMIEELAAPTARRAGSRQSVPAHQHSPPGSTPPSPTSYSAPTPTSRLPRCSPRPGGRSDGGGRFTIDGRWPFASGCRHAEWLLAGMFVFDGDSPRMIPDRGPDWRLAFFPRADGDIVENWDILGLRATGSNDIIARALRVATTRQ